eukprot:TRINITY_DN18875_c0_g1_i1.p1 TRINITY_DN18875_c0_g1~~TRINITY_DN18875_c0_g1_i1.p1  ORF type:complete len:625 (+),score=105.38 TRINITY_DN18875_c0_g1_i1:84-1877(+)
MRRHSRCVTTATRAAARGEKRFYKFEELPSKNTLGLPRVPIPELKGTIEKYLSSVKAVCTEEEYKSQLNATQEFLNTEGPSLQNKIVQRDHEASKHGGYPAFHFQPYWDDMYLGMRCPCPVNSNPYYIFKKHDDDKSQASVTARVIWSATSWWADLKKGNTAVEQTKAGPLCMGTFPYIIATSRIPGAVADTIHHCPDSDYIVVFFKGKPYKVVVSNVSVESLTESLESIIAHGTPQDASREIAVLTSDDRTDWADSRSVIMKDPNTKHTVDIIDNALFIVSLDSNDKELPMVEQCRSHLVGLPDTIADRWWDKLMITSTPQCNVGLVMEHAPADGAYWNTWLAKSWEIYMEKTSPVSQTNPTAIPQPLSVGEVPEKLVAIAREKNRTVSESLDMAFREITTVGSSQIKAAKMPPDAYFQVCLQVAYYLKHGEIAATYESASMRNFWRGRTDTIRSCTPEVVELAKCVKEGGKKDLRQLLVNATTMHRNITGYTLQGEGIDRHLLSLNQARDDPASPHPLFTSSAFKKSSTWTLSTSNVTSPFLATFGFGPVSATGYGVGYQLFPETVPLAITSYEKGGSAELSGVLEGVLYDLLRA